MNELRDYTLDDLNNRNYNLIRGLEETFKIRASNFDTTMQELIRCYGWNKIYEVAQPYIDFYTIFEESPYKTAYVCFGSEYDTDKMMSDMFFNPTYRDQYNKCNKLYCSRIKQTSYYTESYTSLVCNYCFEKDSYFDNIAHSDYTSLYPNIYSKILLGKGSEYYHLVYNKSLELKKQGNKRERAIYKLLINSYWGYASNYNKLFKSYLLFMEKVHIQNMIDCYEQPILVKTDGVFGKPYEDTKERLQQLEIESEYDSPRELFVHNVSNYIYGDEPSGCLFHDKISDKPTYPLRNFFKDKVVSPYRRVNGKIIDCSKRCGFDNKIQSLCNSWAKIKSL